MERILVVFQATQAHTESMALAFGLGAVEGGGNIRLRHLAGETPATLEHRGYGRLKNADLEWAELLALGIESTQATQELHTLFTGLVDLGKTNSLQGKQAYLFGQSAPTPSIEAAAQALESAGFTLVAPSRASLSDDPEHLRTSARSLVARTDTL